MPLGVDSSSLTSSRAMHSSGLARMRGSGRGTGVDLVCQDSLPDAHCMGLAGPSRLLQPWQRVVTQLGLQCKACTEGFFHGVGIGKAYASQFMLGLSAAATMQQESRYQRHTAPRLCRSQLRSRLVAMLRHGSMPPAWNPSTQISTAYRWTGSSVEAFGTVRRGALSLGKGLRCKID